MSRLFKCKLPQSLLLLALALFFVMPAAAQTQASLPTPQFEMTGFIQEATLDETGSVCAPTDSLLAGGTMTINGIKMVVPCNTILQMPATALTWAQLFSSNLSAPVPPDTSISAQSTGQTGLALSDSPRAFPSIEVRVLGNIVNGKYIIGLIAPISQHALNQGNGLISFIDYTTGFFRVGGIADDPDCAANGILSPNCTGALVRINDPVGRFGLPHSPDPRFTADTNNPTIHASTGYPVCIPRSNPAVLDDPLCPNGNRPLNGDPRFPVDPFISAGMPLKTFDMPQPSEGSFPDSRQQAPLKVGDWVNFSGTLTRINPSLGNNPANSYMSVHTLTANLGIFTAPGSQPAYVAVEEVLLGTGGIPITGINQEATNRIFLEGATTDPTGFITIFAIDVNPCTGAETERFLGTADPASQPVRGRFRLSLNTGFFGSPTRELIARSTIGVISNVANGLSAGEYRLPNFEFIFPENHTFGQPLIPGNFQDIPFLAQGSGPLFGNGPVVGQLDPWPGNPVPTKTECSNVGIAPRVSAGADFAAYSGTRIKLPGSVTLDPKSNGGFVSWKQTGGPATALSGPNSLTPSFNAPVVLPGNPVSRLSFKLKVVDQFGKGADAVLVKVKPPGDKVAISRAKWRPSNGGRLSLIATTTNPAAALTVRAFAARDGSVVRLGRMVPLTPLTFSYTATAVTEPSAITVKSTLGGSATAFCLADPIRIGRVSCR